MVHQHPQKSTGQNETLDGPRAAVLAMLDQCGFSLRVASRALGRNDAYLHQYLYRKSPRRLPEDVRHKLARLVACEHTQFLNASEIQHETGLKFDPTDNADNADNAQNNSPGSQEKDTASIGTASIERGGQPLPNESHLGQSPAEITGHVYGNAPGPVPTRIPFIQTGANANACRWGASGGPSDRFDATNSLVLPTSMLNKITPSAGEYLRLLTIIGDSMAPMLEEGDTVMVDFAQTQPSPPGIFIIDDGVGLVAKRLDPIPNTNPQMLRLTSENSAYTNYHRRLDEVNIVGRVVWLARTL